MTPSRAIFVLLVSVCCAAFLYGASIEHLVTIWWTSEAYQPLFVVPLLSLYFAWRRREVLAATPVAPCYWALPLLVGAVALWAVSNAAFIAFGEFVALVLMIHALVLAVLGIRMYRALLLPLWFLCLAVPLGDNLFPPLLSLTVYLSTLGLRLTGAQAVADGSILVTETGRYGVIYECSSLPFIVGNLIVSVVFAELVFEGRRKRSIYIAAGILVALFANVLRIVSVIRLTEISNGAIGLVSAHSVYGWVLFLCVTLAQMRVGARFADPASRRPGHPMSPPIPHAPSSASFLVAFLSVLVLASPRLIAAQMPLVARTGVSLAPCEASAASSGKTPTEWQPIYDHADRRRQWTVPGGGYVVDVFVGHFLTQSAGRELVGWPGRSYDDVHFKFLELAPPRHWPSRLWPMPTAERLRTPSLDRRRVWTWYWADGAVTGHPWLAKLYLARGALLGRGTAGAVLMLSTQERYDPAASELALGEVLDALGRPADVLGRGDACRSSGRLGGRGAGPDVKRHRQGVP